jgi:hypothetical protein
MPGEPTRMATGDGLLQQVGTSVRLENLKRFSTGPQRERILDTNRLFEDGFEQSIEAGQESGVSGSARHSTDDSPVDGEIQADDSVVRVDHTGQSEL